MKKRCTSIIIILLLLLSIVSPFICSIKVYANYETGTDDGGAFFNDEGRAERFNKLYGLFKFGWGLNDEQCAAVMGCIVCETGDIQTASVESASVLEGIYNLNSVEDVCQKFTYDHDKMTDEVIRNYCTVGRYKSDIDANEIIKNARKGKDISSNGLSETAYYVGDIGYAGVGLFGFTGGGCKQLLEYADQQSGDWYDFDLQVEWIFAGKENGGYDKWPKVEEAWDNFREKTKDLKAEEIVPIFAAGSEKSKYGVSSYINGAMPDYQLNNRKNAAKYFRICFEKGYAEPDLKFAQQIMNKLGYKMRSKINNDIYDVSIIHENIAKVIIYPQNQGMLLDQSDETTQAFKDKNTEVYKGYVNSAIGEKDESTKYCLYELFGEDIHWYRYLGEATYAPQLLDRIYSAVEEDRVDQLGISDIFYDNYNYLSCRVYKERPQVLTKDDLANGMKDPRVLALSNGMFSGYKYTMGTIKMSISKYVSAFVSFLLGPKLLNMLGELVNTLETSQFWEVLKPIMWIIVGLAMVFFMASIMKKAKKYAVGRGSAREGIGRFFIGLIALGIMVVALAKPTVFNDYIIKGVTFIDHIFANTLKGNLDPADAEIIKLSDKADDDMMVSAVLWKTCVFNPWCRGQFDGLNYNELYTQYAELEKGQKAMPQDNTDVDPNDNKGTAYYNSVKYTGDVEVPIGGGTNIKNWAAYLYSCGSEYHIDYHTSDKAKNGEIDTTVDPLYPVADTTANDITIMADTFRVIDAQMNIAPQEYKDSDPVNNYEHAHELVNSFSKESTVMLLNTLLLIFFIPIIAAKFKNFTLMIIIAVQVIYHSILELFKEDSGFREYGRTFKNAFFKYLIACLKGNIMLVLFMKFVDKGFVRMVIYCILCLVILSFNLNDLRRMARNTKYKLRALRSKR